MIPEVLSKNPGGNGSPEAVGARSVIMVEPRWALAVQIGLAWCVLVSWMTMLSFVLTGDRLPALAAAGVGLAFTALVPPALWAIDRNSEEAAIGSSGREEAA